MNTDHRVAVCSRSFSRHQTLRNGLLERYQNVTFNDDGLKLSGDSLVDFLSGHDKAIIGLETIDERLQGLWGLHRTGNLKEKELLSLVKDKEEHMRIWALKLLVDEGKVSKQASKAIIEQAQSEKSSLVITL